ncbi:Membrane protein involved in the export of O-antigen and teichoic acid [Tenacibaculum sp. MAR_2009_124]|uniref:sugar isomerase n=1 Tax=Tenacibaculum sp. MAR_2009_124 TaxID=1250059 RepID=UPI0008951064|nr:sugar isomerase [Tenacibaculum sp. MAR_2009_124]SEB50715.1 Membrane protein involved in the export of O-antigen and teichoic acid [Tenacibaculum sp. MAR_2009_124]
MQVSILNNVKKISSAQWFMISVMFVNAGNYLYNLILGRWLGPILFADVAVLITLLLVLSFLAMTIQLLCAKFVIEIPPERTNNFKKVTYKYTLLFSGIIGVLCMVFSDQLIDIFHLNNKLIFYLFGLGVPVYFVMSVSRGLHQGKQQFISLSQSYLLEMLGRLSLTFILIGFDVVHPTIAVTFGILFSFVLGLFPNQFSLSALKVKSVLMETETKAIYKFLFITALYEGTQIIINNSDILIVKHYFESNSAGLYASLALIGRVVYFVIWMLVMVLLPKVILAKKEGSDPEKILTGYLKFIVALTLTLVVGCYLFPDTIIAMLFGKQYVSMGPLLYKYALATSLFALANVFVYYFLSLSKYIPVIFAMFFGLLQVAGLILFHKTLEQVVHVQILLMSILLLFTLLYYFKNKSN